MQFLNDFIVLFLMVFFREKLKTYVIDSDY